STPCRALPTASCARSFATCPRQIAPPRWVTTSRWLPEVSMDSALLKLYHRLPAPLRSAAATMRGMYLARCRYGEDSAELAEQVRVRDQWTAAQWSVWREERLGYVLHRAATRAPYY